MSQFSLLEFDDHEAYQVEAGKMRGRVTILTRCIVRSDPINAIQHLGSSLTMVSKYKKRRRACNHIYGKALVVIVIVIFLRMEAL